MIATTSRWIRFVGGAALGVLAVVSSHQTLAQASPDRPAAVLVYPYIVVDPASGTDTTIQLTNRGREPIDVSCFYENFTPQCTSGDPDASCLSAPVTCTGLCIPRQSRIDLQLRPIAGQPLAWRASTGLSEPPPGDRFGVTEVPALGGPFIGTLRCVALGPPPHRPSEANVLVGQAIIERHAFSPQPYADSAIYGAIGHRAIVNRINGDEFLKLGGVNGEYEGCPNYGIVEHFTDGVELHAGESTATIRTTLVLVNCSRNLDRPAEHVAQFLVHNEFSQRFSTSGRIDGQWVTPISQIDTRNPQSSIFASGVLGTAGAHTLIRGPAGGFYVMAIESRSDPASGGPSHSDAFPAHGYAERPTADYLTYRRLRCVGDCDLDGQVVIYEVIAGVNQVFGTLPIAACVPMDANLDSTVTVDEVIRSVDNALARCPEEASTPAPDPQPTPAPTLSPAEGMGPEIIHFGVATADDIPLSADDVDDLGRPVFVRRFGQGMTLVVEARRGGSGGFIAQARSYAPDGSLPDLQVLSSRPLGDGDPAVCEDDGQRGGIPGVADLEFSTDPVTVAAINDLGCRAYHRVALGEDAPCTRRIPHGTFRFVVNEPRAVQFCIPIAKAWAFPVGETTVAVRLRDDAGNVGRVKQIVVRVLEP